MENQITWVDMPVLDLDRAISFYSAILAGKVEKEQYEAFTFGLLPHVQTNVSGCLIPSSAEDIINRGVLIYFNVEGRIDDAINQVSPHGGEIIEAKHSMGPHGYRAIIKDSEGNRIALHSNS